MSIVNCLLLFILITFSPELLRAEDDPHEAKGYIYTKQIDGVWWFINAEGKPFVSIGVNHVEPHLWLAPYNKSYTLKQYGSDLVDEAGT